MRWERTTAIILAIACLLAMTGCRTTRQAVQLKQTATNNIQTNVSRTDTVFKHDTISVRQSSRIEIRQREVPINVELPQAEIQKETHDTTSVIETPYFTSKATWSNGKLTHTFTTKPGAAIATKVVVADTTRQESNTTERLTSTKAVSRTDSSSVAKTKQIIIGKKELGRWKTFKTAAITAGIVLLLTAIVAALLYFNRGSAFFKRKS